MKSLKALFSIDIPVQEAFEVMQRIPDFPAVVRKFGIVNQSLESKTIQIDSGEAEIESAKGQRIVFTFRHPSLADELVGTIGFKEGWIEFRIHNFADNIDLRPISARLRLFMKILLPLSCRYFEEGGNGLIRRHRSPGRTKEPLSENSSPDASSPKKPRYRPVFENSSSPKRPRGRPRKPLPENPPPKRPRGRPRKPLPENPPPKRPRGRPRKTIPLLFNEIANQGASR